MKKSLVLLSMLVVCLCSINAFGIEAGDFRKAAEQGLPMHNIIPLYAMISATALPKILRTLPRQYADPGNRRTTGAKSRS